MRQWHFRYFVLSKECLCYYRTEQESKYEVPRELIFFNDMSVYVEDIPEKRTKYCLRIVKKSPMTLRAPRTLTVCCLNEDERNSWLSKILHAKAISLVNDRSWVNERKRRSGSEGSTDSCPERSTAKEALHRCKRKLSLGANRASYSLEEFCRSRVKTNLTTHWRNTLMDISLVTMKCRITSG